MRSIFVFILFGFSIGGLWFFISGRKKDREEKRRRGAKYWSYAGIVIGTTLLATLGGMYWFVFCLLLSVGAIVEVGKTIFKLSGTVRIPVVMAVLLIFPLFCGSGFFFSNRVLVFTYLSVAVFDAFSQLTGQSLGRTKMAPQISPNKTWEGFAGGFFFSTLFGIFFFWSGEKSLLEVFFLSFGVAILGLSGDLIASWLKRKANIKDYSDLLPGHGGILDRFDSLIFTLAVFSLFRIVEFFYTKL
ncbi:phosphatidate cytidylyltransferase [Leptospira stimsonii]|uniref:phosphatidate cytidylyltransferase n=1 Tax=Leptospira stimsonii TaxID=2202203 RepID=UPI0013140834|nr:phosphatidate cytidylyltransferase [Leptospira stimsonii]